MLVSGVFSFNIFGLGLSVTMKPKPREYGEERREAIYNGILFCFHFMLVVLGLFSIQLNLILTCVNREHQVFRMRKGDTYQELTGQ